VFEGQYTLRAAAFKLVPEDCVLTHKCTNTAANNTIIPKHAEASSGFLQPAAPAALRLSTARRVYSEAHTAATAVPKASASAAGTLGSES